MKLDLKTFAWEFWLFGIKQARACVFGGYLLFWMLLTSLWYPITSLPRYDLLFILAILFQAILLLFRLESWREALVILVFHLVATGMELFKTSIGAWRYPEEFNLGIGHVPLFAGFMYSAVGSYIARVWRIFDFQFSSYPPIWATCVLVALIYANFFTNHWVFDFGFVLLAGAFVLYGRVWIYFKMDRRHRRMPLMLGLSLVATFIWFAENIGTYANIWIYPSQESGWHMVHVSKLIAWLLLMMLSFVLVSLVHRPVVRGEASEASRPQPA
ncbi:MAG: DUF817 domain-containing protein [Pirellulaceae bacterium]